MFVPTLAFDDLRALRAAGANLVQLSVPAPTREGNRVHLDRLVDWATEAGLYVIVAFRTAEGRSEGDLSVGEKVRTLFESPAQQHAFSRMWRELALDYRKRPNVIGYDLLVEPHDVEIATWTKIAQVAIDAIRSVDPDTAIIVEAPQWANAASLETLTPLVGEHLAYGVHQYEPYRYTHEAQPTWSAEELAAPFRVIDAFVKRTGAVVIVNEWGARIDRPNVDAFFREQLGQLRARDLDHAVWLWEVADPSGYRAFDVRSSPALARVLREGWSAPCVTCTP